MNTSKISELLEFISVIKDCTTEQSTNAGGNVLYDLQVSLQTAPKTDLNISALSSQLEALSDALRKFNPDDTIGWNIAIPANSRSTRDLQQTIQARMETKSSLKSAGGLVTPKDAA